MKQQRLLAALGALSLAFVAACAGNRVDVTKAVSHLHKTGAATGGMRLLADLDADGNSVINAADRLFFESLADAARAALGEEGNRLAVEHGLFEGAPKDAPPIFSLVDAADGKLDLKRVPKERLRELAIEAAWAAAQARIASLSKAPIAGRTFGGMFQDLVNGYNPDQMRPGAVCEAIEAFDTKPFVEAGVPLVVVMDLDSTVWLGNVSDVFLAWLAERGLPKDEANPPLQTFLKTIEGVDAAVVDANTPAQNALLLYERHVNKDLPRSQRVNSADTFYNIVGLLRGSTVAEVQAAARSVFSEGGGQYPPWRNRMFASSDGCGTRRIIKMLRDKGFEVFALSATLGVLAREGASFVGLDAEHVMGSPLEVQDGKFTGKVVASTYYAKASIARQWLPGPPLFAFGDSPTSDFGMLLEAAATAFMINPRPEFVEKDDSEAGSRFVALWFDGTEAEVAAKP